MFDTHITNNFLCPRHIHKGNSRIKKKKKEKNKVAEGQKFISFHSVSFVFRVQNDMYIIL